MHSGESPNISWDCATLSREVSRGFNKAKNAGHSLKALRIFKKILGHFQEMVTIRLYIRVLSETYCI